MNKTNTNDPSIRQSRHPGLDYHERMRLRAAAFRATSVYPGPVGELLSRELLLWEECGYRLGTAGLINGVVDAIMTSLPA